MSDEQRKDEESEVAGHLRRRGAQDEPAEDDGGEIEAHVYRTASARMDSPSES